MPAPRSSAQAVLMPNGKQLLMFGGEFGTSKENKFLHFSDTWIYDFASHSWRSLSLKEHPSGRSGHRMILLQNRWIVLFGGFIDCGRSVRYLDDVWAFDCQEMTWKPVTLANEYESRPAARSGFVFVPHAEGGLIYGGYCQVKGKSGSLSGKVLNDLWFLRTEEVSGSTLSIRWKKLKLAPNAPIPRSGVSAVPLSSGEILSMIIFGGVVDEEVSDEHIMGTCVRDFYHFQLGPSLNEWELFHPTPPIESFCGRFNAMLCADINKSKLFMYPFTLPFCLFLEWEVFLKLVTSSLLWMICTNSIFRQSNFHVFSLSVKSCKVAGS